VEKKKIASLGSIYAEVEVVIWPYVFILPDISQSAIAVGCDDFLCIVGGAVVGDDDLEI
jgi:hypothetical protein